MIAAGTSALRAPGRFVSHLALVWQLRLMTAANRFRGASGAAPAAVGTAALLAVSILLGLGAYAALAHPAVAASPRWTRFILRLLTFLLSVVFVVWPVLSAGVDESSELSRFATFPIRPRELFVASCVSGLFEPRALLFYPAIAGAALGFAAQRPFPLLPGVCLGVAYVAFNVAWGRAGLNLVLNVLRHRRSAEILGLLFLASLFLASLAPPVDVSWLPELFQKGLGLGPDQKVDEALLLATSEALAGVPPCGLALGLEALARGETGRAVFHLLSLCFWSLVGFVLAYRLLLRFYRNTARPPKKPRAERPIVSRRARNGAFWALVDREAADFVRNPKARLLCAVPFFLCILLRWAHARELVAAAMGPAADAWLLALLTSYAALVVGANFAQNVFAYDGPGLALLLAAPVESRALFAAKNAVHAAGATVVSLALVAFYGLYIHPLSPAEAAVGVLAPLVELPVLLTAGNLVSVAAPRKYHASLRRRDRAPALATFTGLAAAIAAVAPLGLLLRLLDGGRPPSAATIATLVVVGAACWAIYVRILPRAAALFDARRETVLRLVTRE